MSELTFNTGAQLAKVKFDEEVDNMLLHLEQAFCRPVQQTMYNCMAECQINAPRGEVGNCMDACKEEMNVLKQGISDEIKKFLDYQRADFDACAQTAQNKSNPTVYFSEYVF